MSEPQNLSDLILKSANLLFFGINPEGTITLANAKSRDWLELDFDEMEFHPLNTLLHSDCGINDPKSLKGFLSKSCQEPQLISLKKKSGIKVQAVVTTSILENSPSPHLYYISYFTPIPAGTHPPELADRPTELCLPQPIHHELKPFQSLQTLEFPDETLETKEPEPHFLPETLSSPVWEKNSEISQPTPLFEQPFKNWFWEDKLPLLKLEEFLPYRFRIENQPILSPATIEGESHESPDGFSTLKNPVLNIREIPGESELERVIGEAIVYEDRPVSHPEGLNLESALKELKRFQNDGKKILLRVLFYMERVLSKANQTISAKGQYLINSTEKLRDPAFKEMKNAVKSMFGSLRSIKRMQNSLEKLNFSEDTSKKISLSFSEIYQVMLPDLEKDLAMKNIEVANETQDFLFIANSLEMKYIFSILLDLLMGFTRDNSSIRIYAEIVSGNRSIVFLADSHIFDPKSTIYDQVLVDKKLDFGIASILALTYGIRISYGTGPEGFYLQLHFPDF